MKLTSDYKMVIVLNEELPLGLKTNTAAVLSLTIGKKLDGLIGPDLTDKSQHVHTGLTTIPLPILKSDSMKLAQIYHDAYTLRNELLLVDVTDAAQTTKNYHDYQLKLEQTLVSDLQFLGLALAGPKQIVSQLTGNLGLVR